MDEAKPAALADIRLVIAASSLGTAFEWYDFYVYAALAALFGKMFFPGGGGALGFLLALATFGVGFAIRPLGAALFGTLGDRLGRKYTFLVTITLMGFATAAMGLLQSYAKIGIAAPILLVSLRGLQGLAVGGEYGGAAIYVCEHAPPHKRGLYTGWIQIGAAGGFMLSLLVVLITSAVVGEAAWQDWGWRIPFLFSLILLAISLWVRLKLAESPVFAALRAAGETARNPLAESCNTPAKLRRLVAVTIGIAAGQSIIGYTGMIQVLNFLQVTEHLDPTITRQILIATLALGAAAALFFGWLSDRLGRKKLVVMAYALFLAVLFPSFHVIAGLANPVLAAAVRANPVVVAGSDCGYNPFALRGQSTACGKVLDALSKTGVPYRKREVAAGTPPVVTIGAARVDAAQPNQLNAALAAAGYARGPVRPTLRSIVLIALALVPIALLGGMAYGPVASWMTELFPARIRYTSLSVPYNLGVGYFAGFMPFIVQYIVAKTGDPYAGFWYPFGAVLLALIVALALPETAGADLD